MSQIVIQPTAFDPFNVKNERREDYISCRREDDGSITWSISIMDIFTLMRAEPINNLSAYLENKFKRNLLLTNSNRRENVDSFVLEHFFRKNSKLPVVTFEINYNPATGTQTLMGCKSENLDESRIGAVRSLNDIDAVQNPENALRKAYEASKGLLGEIPIKLGFTKAVTNSLIINLSQKLAEITKENNLDVMESDRGSTPIRITGPIRWASAVFNLNTFMKHFGIENTPDFSRLKSLFETIQQGNVNSVRADRALAKSDEPGEKELQKQCDDLVLNGRDSLVFAKMFEDNYLALQLLKRLATSASSRIVAIEFEQSRIGQNKFYGQVRVQTAEGEIINTEVIETIARNDSEAQREWAREFWQRYVNDTKFQDYYWQANPLIEHDFTERNTGHRKHAQTTSTVLSPSR